MAARKYKKKNNEVKDPYPVLSLYAISLDGNALEYEDFLKIRKGRHGDIVKLKNGIEYRLEYIPQNDEDTYNYKRKSGMKQNRSYITYGRNETYDNR